MARYTPTWVLLLDGARGRILVQESPGAGLRRALGDGFTGSRALDHELGDDRPGRSRASRGDPGGHVFDPRSSPHERAEHEFCATVADFVSRAVSERRLERLILVAPPKTLGDLRRTLSPQALARIRSEIARDWIDLPDAEIEGRLGDALLSPLASPSLA